MNYISKANRSQIRNAVNRKQFSDSENLFQVTMVELKKIYWFEKQLLIALKILIDTSTTEDVAELLKLQSQYTEDHINQLELKFPTIHKIFDNDLKDKNLV